MPLRRTRLLLALTVSLLGVAVQARAEYLVVTAGNLQGNLSRSAVCDLFLGESDTVFGYEVKVFLLAEPEAIESFYRDVCDKRITTVRRKWASQVFSGRQQVSPPRLMENLHTFINETRGREAITFITDTDQRSDELRVLYRFP